MRTPWPEITAVVGLSAGATLSTRKPSVSVKNARVSSRFEQGRTTCAASTCSRIGCQRNSFRNELDLPRRTSAWSTYGAAALNAARVFDRAKDAMARQASRVSGPSAFSVW